MNNNKNIDDEIKAFLSNDPVPELDDWEVKVLTQRVLARSKKRKPFTIFGFKPAWGIGVAAVAMLFLFALKIAPPDLHPQTQAYTEFSDDTLPEDMLYDAISNGEIEEGTVIAGFVEVDEQEIEEIYYTYSDNEIDAAVEMLSDEEAENVLRYISDMDYTGGEEVL